MPQAVIVALHGMNDYSNAFCHARAHGGRRKAITTYAYDQRGFGRSPQIGIWPGSDLMRRDLSDFVDVVRMRHPGVPVFVLGESMGGAVAMTAFASDTPPKADGLILVAPAVWGRRDHAVPLSRRAVDERAHRPLEVVLRLGAEDHTERQHRDAARERPRSAVPQERAQPMPSTAW